jgi:hypothetical protein
MEKISQAVGVKNEEVLHSVKLGKEYHVYNK